MLAGPFPVPLADLTITIPMSELLKNAFDADEFRLSGHQLIDVLADYLHSATAGTEMPVLPPSDPDDLYKFWLNYPAEPDFDFLAFNREIIHQSNHIHHPRYVGHQVVPPLPMAVLSELTSALLNNGMAIYEMGPASTAMERIVIEWLAKHMGMPDTAGGVLTSGGSAGNLTGLLAARQAMCEHNVWDEGHTRQLAVMVSSEAHYSVARACRIMGWGSTGVVPVPVNRQMQADPDSFESCLENATRQGQKVIAIVGNACTTSTGTYDDLAAMADFAGRHKLWFHIDGAHGAGAALSEKYRHLTEGITLADSVVIDFHKMLLTPALTTAVIFKDVRHSFETFQQKAEYLLAAKNPWFDGAARSLECTKKMMSLKVFALIKKYGKQIFTQYIDQSYGLGESFADLIRSQPDFELALEPQSNIVCFRYVAVNPTVDINALNRKIRNALLEDGSFYLVQTNINGNNYLRTTLMNPFTTPLHLKQLLELIRRFAMLLLKEAK